MHLRMICIFGVSLSAYLANRDVCSMVYRRKSMQGSRTSYSPKVMLLSFICTPACLLLELICPIVTTVQWYTANEGPVRILYKCLVPIYVSPELKLLFPKQNHNVLSPSSYSHISVTDLRVYNSRSICLLCCRTDPGNI
jgi:hypothetical protein